MMKKKLLFLVALVCSMSLFSACSDDDKPVLPIEQDLAGNYKGELGISIDGQSLGNLPQKVYITKSAAGENQLKLELKSFMFASLNLGDIQVDPCVVTENAGTYSFTGSQTITLAAPIGACPVTVNGTCKDGKISINIGVKVEALNQNVTAIFDGTKLSGSESSEAKITKFIFDPKVAAVDSLVLETTIDEANKTISIAVADTAKAKYLKMLVPTIEVSAKAILTPGSGIVQDFSQPVKYTVMAEDGTMVEYTASVKGTKYDFEAWFDGGMYPDVPNPAGWATCNDAVALIKNFGSFAGITYEGEYPVRPTDDVVSGEKALLMQSVDTKGGNLLGQNVPKVTAGTAFLGTFNAFAALQNPMATTSFGILYDRKPIEVTGQFKYKAGTDFYNAKGEKIDQKDECSIAAVLYEVEKEEDTLNGSTLYTSDKIVARAMYNSKGQADYAPFSLKLNYEKPYDKTKKYKFAIIFSASKDGAKYEAAIGSTLCIDDVEIISE